MSPGLCQLLFLTVLVTGAAATGQKLHEPSFKLDATELSCIASWQELLAIFQNEAKKKGLSLIPSSRDPFPVLVIHFRNYTREAFGVSNDGITFNSSSYCQLSDSEDECAMIAVYSQPIFSFYPAALLIYLGTLWDLPHMHSWLLKHTTTETSWRLPLPFCSGFFEDEIVKDFLYEVRHNDGTIYSGTCLRWSLHVLEQPSL